MSHEVQVSRPDLFKTAAFTVGVAASTIVTQSSKGGLVVKNGDGSNTLWIRDPEEGEPANGVGYPIAPGQELALGDYRGILRAISPSGNISVYVAWTTHSRIE